MKAFNISKVLAGVLLIQIVFCISAGYAQLTTVQPTPAPVINKDTEHTATIATLRSIIQSSEAVEEQVQEKETLLEKAQGEEHRARVLKEISELTVQLERLQQDFEAIATGVDLENFRTKQRTQFDWKGELEDIFGPIIDELKDMTARPRELEKLRSDVEYYKRRLPIVKDALEQIQILQTEATARKMQNWLQVVEKQWENEEQAMTNQLAIAEYQLEEKLQEEKSVVTSLQNLVRVFFRSRGRNFLLALLAFAGVFFLLRRFHNIIFRFRPGEQVKPRSFYLRLAEVGYHLLTFVIAISVLIFVLYGSGDWVLLGLTLIFLFGLIWTARQGLPLFWEQIKLLLNLSTVREGERVIYNGLPWLVKSLNLYTKLHNPALKGGLIRLPVRELIGYHSRPFYKDEPWFPCQEGNFVLLSDDTYGQVVMQTPETVQVIYRRSRKTYPTSDFVQLHPINLSDGFILYITFGVDYAHQAIVTQQVPNTLQEEILNALNRNGYGDMLQSLRVYFKEAGASSLDFIVLADFSEQAAALYYVLSWTIQKICVDACNIHEWGIPFTQITVHQAE